MRPLIVLIAIFLVPLSLFAIHIFQDTRGKNRNKLGLCYACGNAECPTVIVHHHKGGAFLYCSRCAKRQGLFKGVLFSIAVLAIAVTLAIQSLVMFESEPTKSILFLLMALSIVALLIFGAVIYIRRQYKQSIYSVNQPDDPIVADPEISVVFAKTRSEMQAVFQEGMRLESQGKLDSIAKARIEAQLQDISTKLNKDLADRL